MSSMKYKVVRVFRTFDKNGNQIENKLETRTFKIFKHALAFAYKVGEYATTCYLYKDNKFMWELHACGKKYHETWR